VKPVIFLTLILFMIFPAQTFAHNKERQSDPNILNHACDPTVIGKYKPSTEKLDEISVTPLRWIHSKLPTAADVYVHGRYAYVTTHYFYGDSEDGVRVFDLSNPEKPSEVGMIADQLKGSWKEKIVVKRVNTPYFKGDLAAISVQTRNHDDPNVPTGTVLYDVTNPLHARMLSFWTLPPGSHGTHELDIAVQGDRVLLLTANNFLDITSKGEYHDFQITDITNPTSPTTIFSWDPNSHISLYNYSEFVDPFGIKRFAYAHSVLVDPKGIYAYVSYWDLGTLIFDISNPEKPSLVGRTSFEKDVLGAAHSAAVADDGNILVETREVLTPIPADSGMEKGWGYVRIYNIEDKSKPKLIGQYQSENARTNFDNVYPGFSVHHPKLDGNRLYLSHYFDGVRVVDITDPSQPKEIGHYQAHNANVWGVNLSNNYIYASDMCQGLVVLQESSESGGLSPFIVLASIAMVLTTAVISIYLSIKN